MIPGIASNLEMLATTRPYYRSTYVLVTRTKRHLDLAGFDDERLRALEIGVQMIGDDFSNTPPAHVLARRGITQDVRGYMVYGDYAKNAPPRAIVEAVANGEIDVAIVWGPLAGYYSARSKEPLTVKPVGPIVDGNLLPMTFEISMGVRKEDRALREELDGVLERRRGGDSENFGGVPRTARHLPRGEVARSGPLLRTMRSRHSGILPSR